MFFSIRRVAALALAAACLARVALADGPNGKQLKDSMPWYHSSEELASVLDGLAGNCPNVTFSKESQSQGAVSLDVLRMSRGDPGQPGKTKAMLVFGEHARELITVESGLELVKALCGAGANADNAAQVLDKVDLTIFPNANPIGRKQVEEGASCKRTNEDGVDLNRNWGDEHRGDEDRTEMNPGPFGFSEPETKILRDVATREKPDVYLSVHSGAYLLGRPFGYSGEREVPNAASMDSMLSAISDQHCGGGCPFGSLERDIGYKSKGCDIDYISEHVGTPYVFEWEIYADPKLREYYNEEASFRSGGPELSQDAKSFFFSQGLNLVQVHGRQRRLRGAERALRVGALDADRTPATEGSENLSDCSKQFNPQNAQETQAVVDNWTGAYLELMQLVSAQKARGSAPAVAVPKLSEEAVMKQKQADEAEEESSPPAVIAKLNAFLTGKPDPASMFDA